MFKKHAFFYTMKTLILKKLLLAIAVAGIVSSCSKKEDFSGQDDQQIEDVQIGLTFRKASLRNQPVEFKIFDDEGNEVIDNLSFYVDGGLITANTFESGTEGSHEVYAEYELNGTVYTTEVESFDIIVPKTKVVLEDYTGTWCGYCPSMDAAINDVAAITSDISVVAIHNNDDLALAIEPTIRDEFGVFGFPSGRINRTTNWGSALNFPLEQATDIAGGANTTTIAIATELNNGSLLAKISVASEESIQDKKLVVYLIEDGIIRDQTNYFNGDEDSPYFEMGNPIPDFELNHVLRASLSDVFGDPIASTAALTDYETNYSFTIPGDFVVANLALVVMVVDQENTAINSQHVKVNESVSYQ